LLKRARQANPKLRICSLDYWDPDARKEIRRIYRVERANGFAPYVATRELDRVVREP
jgi:polysaccharide biosynthesis protein PelA